MTGHKPPRMRPPMQPVVLDEQGVARFQRNSLVRYLLDRGGLDINKLAHIAGIPRSDWEQFAQLIGYSVSGFGDLPYARKSTIAKADARAEAMLARRKRAGRPRLLKPDGQQAKRKPKGRGR